MVKLSSAGSGLVIRPHHHLTRIVSGTSLIEPMPVFLRPSQPPRSAHVPRLSRDSVVGTHTPLVLEQDARAFLPGIRFLVARLRPPQPLASRRWTETEGLLLRPKG